jgi:predicted DNA-binding transcriptional regulator YafY
VVEASGDVSMLKLGSDELEWLAGRLAALGFDFEVLEPAELRAYVRELGKRLVDAHRGR